MLSKAWRRILSKGDTYNGTMNNNIVGGRGNLNHLDIHNYGSAEPGFDKFCQYVAANAVHNSIEISEHPKCHPGTREAILEHLTTLAAETTFKYPIIWLHGPAGAGKSAIERTVANILFEKGHLLASFFFFRSSSRRNSSDYFMATIAYQIALSVPAAKSFVLKAFEKDPLIFSKSLLHQADVLVISPIRRAWTDPAFKAHKHPRIFVIDGLDECQYIDKQIEILQVLRHVLEELPFPVAVLLASRPEHHIRAIFDTDLLPCSSRISLDNSFDSDSDIRKYLSDNFYAISQTHHLKSSLRPVPWPSSDTIEHLVAKASGQFIYVSTVIKFVKDPRDNPARRLKSIVKGGAGRYRKPFEQLDDLYSLIFDVVEKDELPTTLRVLGFLLLDSPNLDLHFSEDIERLLGLDYGDVWRSLFDLSSLLDVDKEGSIKVFHASLSDYLFDSSRSGAFWIDTRGIYADLLERCIGLLPGSTGWLWEDVSSWTRDKMVPLLVDNSELLFSKATLSRGLRQALRDWDLEGLITGNKPKSGLLTWQQAFEVGRVCPAILNGVMMSPFPDAKALLISKRRTMEQIVRSKMVTYFTSHIGFECFFVIAIFLSRSMAFDFKELLNLTSQDLYKDRHEGFYLAHMPNTTATLLPFAEKCLSDPRERNHVSADRYADITIYFLERWKDRKEYALAFGSIVPDFLKFLVSKSSKRDDLMEALQNVSTSVLSSKLSSDQVIKVQDQLRP